MLTIRDSFWNHVGIFAEKMKSRSIGGQENSRNPAKVNVGSMSSPAVPARLEERFSPRIQGYREKAERIARESGINYYI